MDCIVVGDEVGGVVLCLDEFVVFVSVGFLCVDGVVDEWVDGGDGCLEEGGGVGFVVEFGKYFDEIEGWLVE